MFVKIQALAPLAKLFLVLAVRRDSGILFHSTAPRYIKPWFLLFFILGTWTLPSWFCLVLWNWFCSFVSLSEIQGTELVFRIENISDSVWYAVNWLTDKYPVALSIDSTVTWSDFLFLMITLISVFCNTWIFLMELFFVSSSDIWV